MKPYKVHTRESGHAIYIIEAESPQEAEDIWGNGGVTEADLLEMTEAEIDFVEEIEE